MHKTLIDPPTLEKLRNLDSRLEMCDESGRTLVCAVGGARKTPLRLGRGELTNHEIEAARNEPGGYQLDEILAELNGA